jgi:hypothetical protein
VLSTARCRALLGLQSSLTQAQLEQLRQDLYTLAQITIEGFRKREERTDIAPGAIGLPSIRAPFNIRTLTHLTAEDHDSLEERSAILEFEAGFDREPAEKEALLEWAGRKSRRVTSKDKRVRKKKF